MPISTRFGFRLAATLVAAVLLVPTAAQEPQAEPDSEQPRRTDLVETTERRLVQIDVTAQGKREAITDLGPEDFHLAVAGSDIKSFTVDNLCVLPTEKSSVVMVDADTAAPGETATPAPLPLRPKTTYLFYFDQHHLTMEGRQRSLDLARQLFPELIVDGNKAMIVSAGKQLETFADLTDDRKELEQAVKRIEADYDQWDPWVALEDHRIAEVLELLNDNPPQVSMALSRARIHQRDEVWRTNKALHLFSIVIGRMTLLPSPKAVIYFADTMRSHAGQHYLSFFSRRTGAVGSTQGLETFDAGHAFDRVVEEATALGIRVFTIQAQGLVSDPANLSLSNESAAGGSSPTANSRRIKDAQDSLVSMAAESGGRAFLNGVRASRIAARINEDLSCIYLVSFDASHLAENRSYRLSLRSNRPGVKFHARGKVTVQSEARRLNSRLLAGFATPDAIQSEARIEGMLIPTGYTKGKYSALVQMVVPGSALSATKWDLGMSLIAKGEVAGDASGSVSLSGPGVPVVLETELEFRPGPFKIVAVAHETTGNTISTGEIESSWPDPDDAPITLGPIAVLQPAHAAILRNETLRREGAVAVGQNQVARTDRPTALIGLVCRAKFRKGGLLRIERKLLGDAGSFAPFGPMELDLGEDRCAQIRDFIPTGSMSSGSFSYEVRVLDDDEVLATAVRKFVAIAADEAAPAAIPAGGGQT